MRISFTNRLAVAPIHRRRYIGHQCGHLHRFSYTFIVGLYFDSSNQVRRYFRVATTKTETQHAGFPKFPADNWRALRKRFAQSIQMTVNENYLSAVLNMKPSSARVRLASLKKVSLINDDGKPTERAKRWRDDSQYAAVCEEIRQSVYPPELLHAFPAPDPDRAGVARWFGHQAGVGEDAANQLASFYLLLCEADVTKLESSASASRVSKTNRGSSSPTNAKTRSQPPQHSSEAHLSSANGAAPVTPQYPNQIGGEGLTLHVDIQVHISPEASAEQIDQIFKSINLHLRHGGDAR